MQQKKECVKTEEDMANSAFNFKLYLIPIINDIFEPCLDEKFLNFLENDDFDNDFDEEKQTSNHFNTEYDSDEDSDNE
ncbi:hypothetical protein BpHYR1_014447 [Brachionus plicatilis]|uniref:Uncharacterized protein n=1 Tax=Brachionus plicatilis TaxID=10195 RepID=A0A3M7RKG8_BRAPC|nr:hypothetical protein BpHYR1_014447 [Brachionus plicatilis]